MTPPVMSDDRAGGVDANVDPFHERCPENFVRDEFRAQALVAYPRWQVFTTEKHVCRVLLCPEEEGGYSVFALRLPGVISQGDTLPEAIANIKEAFVEVLSLYQEGDTGIPWEPVDLDRPKGCLERWILVDA